MILADLCERSYYFMKPLPGLVLNSGAATFEPVSDSQCPMLGLERMRETSVAFRKNTVQARVLPVEGQDWPSDRLRQRFASLVSVNSVCGFISRFYFAAQYRLYLAPGYVPRLLEFPWNLHYLTFLISSRQVLPQSGYRQSP